jgi:long-chain acyl-CoA synthetase
VGAHADAGTPTARLAGSVSAADTGPSGPPDLVSGLGEVFALRPDAPVLHFDDRWFTYGELAGAAARLAQRLEQLDISAGSPVASEMPNTPAAVVVLLAVLTRRACLVPLSPRRAGPELAAVGPAAALVTPGTELDASVEAGDPNAPRQPGVAVLINTAGTSGTPKRVPVTYEAISASLAGTRSMAGKKERRGLREDVTLVPFPFVHMSGIVPLLITLVTGRRVALMRKFEAHEAARLIREHHITSVMLNPTTLAMLLDPAIDAADLATLRYIRSGAAPLSPDLAAAVEARFGVIVMQAYGQTETGGEVIGWSPADHREFADTKRGSVGRPHAGIEPRIVAAGADPEGGGLPVGASGELWLRGVRGRAGWHRTGDLARIDEDRFVWIEGRADDVIICGGFNIAPLAVEQVLARHPGVAEAAVVGVPDQRLGQVPVAVVVARDDPPTEDELTGWCREHLEPYQVPRRYVYVDALPRNEVGKVHRPSAFALAAAEQG